ncbi:MAG: DUF1553 domain-containing protein, partial [Limisphaerales bacterium]
WHPKRNESIGALQALALLNDPWVIHQSQLMAQQLNSQSPHPREQILNLYLKCLLREPSQEETEAMLDYAATHGLANACRFLWNSNGYVFIP